MTLIRRVDILYSTTSRHRRLDFITIPTISRRLSEHIFLIEQIGWTEDPQTFLGVRLMLRKLINYGESNTRTFIESKEFTAPEEGGRCVLLLCAFLISIKRIMSMAVLTRDGPRWRS